MTTYLLRSLLAALLIATCAAFYLYPERYRDTLILYQPLRVVYSMIAPERVHARPVLYHSPFSPGAGESLSLPPMVLDMAKLASKHGIHHFGLSEGLLSHRLYESQDELLYRAVEFLYPVRLTPDSATLFALAQENMPAHCRRADALGDIAIYDCRNK